MKNTLSTTVLLRGVWTGETQNDAVGCQEGAKSVIVEFMTIVSLEGENGTTKLSANKGVKRSEGGECIRFATEGEGPYVMCVIIKND